ncbi:MAG: protein jag [Solirubrobacterales bacterium]
MTDPASSPAESARPDEPAARVRATLEELLARLEIEGIVEVREDEERIEAEISGPELGLLIGRRGQTIDAIQLLCFQIAFRGLRERKHVSVDAAGYRERRREQLERTAGAAASRARETGHEVELEPMTASERKAVHRFLSEQTGIETFSQGEDPHRVLVVAPLIAG